MISFTVPSVRDFISAYDTVCETTQITDRALSNYLVMEASEGQVRFYRNDGGVYSEGFCPAEIVEDGKIIVSKSDLDLLKFCEGPVRVYHDSPYLVLEHSRGKSQLTEKALDLDLYERRVPVGEFRIVPVNLLKLAWFKPEYIKIGPTFIECNESSIKISFYTSPGRIVDYIVFFPQKYSYLAKNGASIMCETGLIWIKNQNSIHRVLGQSQVGRMDITGVEADMFIASRIEKVPDRAAFWVSKKEIEEAMSYVATITTTPELHDGRCSIRFSEEAPVLYFENMRSEGVIQDTAAIPLMSRDLFGKFDCTIFPGQVASALSSLEVDKVRISIMDRTAIRIKTETGITHMIALVDDTWRKKNG